MASPIPDPRPLAGLGVVVTRPEEPGRPLETRLARAGARVLRWQVLAVTPPADPRPLAEAAAHLDRYAWIVFPSPRAVAALERALASLPSRRGLPLHGARVATVGPSTAARARRAGWRVDEVPADSHASGLLAGFTGAGLNGGRILLPQSNLARPILAEGLVALGARVDSVEAYRMVPLDLDAAACRTQLAADEVDVLTFASPSSVDALEKALGKRDFTAALGRAMVATIGPTTSARLLAVGRAADAQAEPSTLAGLVAAVTSLAARARVRGPGA